MKNVLKLAGILFLVCAVMTLLLASVNQVTEPLIEQRTAQDQMEARRTVLPQAEDFRPLEAQGDGSVTEVYEATAGGQVVGYAVSVAPDGYGGKIQAMVGIDLAQNVTGVKITEQSETPGLGAKVAEEDFLVQYLQKGAEAFSVVKSGSPDADEIVAVSGATISSRALTDGVNDALALVKQLGEGSQ